MEATNAAETLTEAEAEALESRNAIRCIKVGLLLSRLQPSHNRRLNSAIDHHDTPPEKEEVLKREIGDLKMEVVRERLRNKRIKLCSLLELSLEVALLILALSALLFAIAFGNGASSVFRD